MKKNRLCVLAYLLCAAMILGAVSMPATARADTPIVEYVDYDITADTTWHAGDYYICKVDNREPRVTNGATLTIESGAKVYFSTRTTATLPGTESEPKNPYSSLTVTNGTLSATGVTFTTVPDSPEETTWQDAGWNGIRAVGAGEAGTTSLSFTNCTFEYSGFNEDGTLYGVQSNGINSEVNISVTGCTFRNPNAGATAIRYNNGHNTIGSGTVFVSNSSFTGYGRGVQVEQNGDDAVNTSVSGCTFSNISIRPLEINGGRQAIITGNSFNNFVTGQHDNPVLIYDSDAPTGTDQTVTFTGNIFNYGSGANIYPAIIGAGCKINEELTSPTITFDADFPAAYRYIVLSRGVGYSSNHRNAVWGDAGIPYLLASEITITGSDATNKSSLTIKPGVTVCLGDGSGSDNLAVRGDLTAIGTAANPITFTKKAGVTYGSEIAVSNTLRGSATLKHCVMDGLYRGIGVISPSASAGLISLENCTVRNTQEPIVLNGHNVLVKNCALIGKGIWIDGVSSASSIMIEGCTITAEGDNPDFGVGIRATKSVTLKNCLIAGFGDCGVAIINNSYQTLADGAPLIENCTVSGNRNGVVYSKTTTFTRYGTFIRNSIISGNTGLDLANKVYTSGESNYPVTIVDGSIAYSLIDDDGSSLTFDGSGHYEHPVLGKISRIASSAYSNRIAGDPLFADATSGDYHLKSTAGRWNGSAWVTDAVASPCIDAGDPASAYANEPAPNGGCINLGCYGNTAEASKSAGGGTADTTPPSWNASSALTASAVTQTGATLSWSGASDDTGVTAYRLYQDGVLVQTTSNTSYAVSGLSPDTDYSFKVEAGDAADNWSTDGPTTPVHTLAATTPSVTVTANPSGSVGVGTAVTLTATPTGIASPSYQWYSNTTASSTGGNEISGATNATYQPSTATAGTIYYYCVVGGVTSNVVGVTVTSAPPVTYTITATAGANGSISPSGAVTVSHGGNQQFAITPNAGYRIADVRVDGSSVGAVSSYTFNNITASHTITASFAYNDDDDTSPRTLTDPATGITASGNISAGAVLTVGNMALGSDAASNTIRSWINAEDYVLLRGVDISLSGSFTGVLTLTLPVGAQYNGETVTILHAKRDGTLATYTATVRNGKVTFDVTGLSPFAVFMEDGLDDIPKTGDAGSAWIWWALLAVSGAGIITLVLTKKKAFQKR